MSYNFKSIEEKWQKMWEEARSFEAKDFDKEKPKFYSLIEFSYPSGSGVHLGNMYAFTGGEIVARKKRKEGYNVLYPYGFDAFGLPAENQAIKENIHPSKIVERNGKYFIEQVKRYGFSFDLSRLIATCDPEYYKWTQWIFIKLFKKGLAYRKNAFINFCPTCNVVLSNEESQGGVCERCKSQVVQKEKEVWFLKITQYADKLLEGLDEIDFTEEMKALQRNWIGKTTGTEIDFKVTNSEDKLKVYTTRPDTIFGATFMVIAPEHPIIEKSKNKIENYAEIMKYKEKAHNKSEFERTQINKDKTGVKIKGIEAINPLSNKIIPIYVSDYVMMNYGTGAIMAVPAHDQRDFDFAKKFNIPIIQVIKDKNNITLEEAYDDDGEMINSGFLNGITNIKEAIEKMTEYLEKENIGKKASKYKMNDWPFNRQRYWGEPIPIIYCPKCGTVCEKEENLPVILPEVEKYKPGTDGKSPLADIAKFVNCKCPYCGENAKRETDTMPQWAGSSWYYLRYMDPHNNEVFADKEKLKYWGQIDNYNGPLEHMTRHIIYSRFWHRFLYDEGYVPTKEPYAKRSKNGNLLGRDGTRMSKSKGNGVDPIEFINSYGADTLRTYLLYLGEYSDDVIWKDENVKGITRFLDRLYSLKEKINNENGYSKTIESLIHKTIKKVLQDYDNMKFNTVISALIILTNECIKLHTITKDDLKAITNLLYPIAPHICAEIWEQIGIDEDIVFAPFPKYDEEKAKDDKITIGVQINGKLRASITISTTATEEEVKTAALEESNIKKHIEGKEIIKFIIVPHRIVNIIIK